MNYTKEQLIKGMSEYYKRYSENPEDFTEVYSKNFEADAIETIEYLLEIIENDK